MYGDTDIKRVAGKAAQRFGIGLEVGQRVALVVTWFRRMPALLFFKTNFHAMDIPLPAEVYFRRATP